MAKRFVCYLCLTLAFLLLSVHSFAESEYDGYVIKFKDAQSEQIALDLIGSAPTVYSGRNEPIITEIITDMDLYKTYNESIIQEFYELGLVEFAEPDYLCELYGYDYSLDNKFSRQWSHKATNIERAWELGAYGQGATVAVIDTGVKADHQDLKGNILEGRVAPEFTSTDTSDPHGHGTGVIGVIAASANGAGVVGVAHKVKVIPIKVPLTDKGKVLNSDLCSAIIKTVSYFSPDVINISIGYTDTSGSSHKQITAAVEEALACGTIIVCAGGNHDSTTYNYPASIDGVVSVSSIKKTSDGSYTHSTYTHNDKITVAAPGQNIYTTSRAAANAYVYDNGTSFASPYVAAVAGIAKSIDPDLTPAHFIELIAQTADKSFLGKGYDDYYGYGVLNAGALIEALINEKSDSIYFSPADYLADGSYTTTAYNASDTELNLGLIEKHETAGKPTAFSFLNIPLAKESVYEIAVPLPHAQENLPQEPEQSETELLSSTEPDTTLYILNPFTLTPWRSPIKY